MDALKGTGVQTERSLVGATPSWGVHPPGFEPGRLHAGTRPLCGVFPGRLWWHRLAPLWPCLVKKKVSDLLLRSLLICCLTSCQSSFQFEA